MEAIPQSEEGFLNDDPQKCYLSPEKVLLLGQAEYRVVKDGKGADAQQDARVLERHRQRYVD